MVLNPVRARLTRKPETYAWSSYRATAGLMPVPPYLTIEWLLARFGRRRATAERKYRTFVAEGIGQDAPWERVQGQVLLGSERFVEGLRAHLQDKHALTEIPRVQRFAGRPALSRLFHARLRTNRAQRDAVIYRAHVEYGYSQSEIGRATGMHYSTISRIVSAATGGRAQNKICPPIYAPQFMTPNSMTPNSTFTNSC